MAQDLKLKIRGLYTHPNDLSEVPDGALAIADNIVIDEESVASPRRGFNTAFELPSSGDRANRVLSYKDQVLIHYGTDSMGYWNGTSFSPYTGVFSPVDISTPVRSAQANRNLYVTTSTGVKKLDAFDGSFRDSGVPRGLTIEGTTSGATGFLPDTETVGYRVVWGYEDQNSNLVLGAPSERLVITNSSGSPADIALTIAVPEEVDETYFFQIYRSANSTVTEPGDELGLVYEAFPTLSEIAALEVVVTDITPEGLTGATLYTSPSQQGILQANEEPPRAKDLAANKGFMFYGNTVSRHRITFTILAADGGGTPGNALQLDDVIEIAGTSYTGKASTDVINAEFAVSTAPTPAQRIDETARELVKVINKHSGNTAVYAYYISGADDLPGRILIEERDFGGAAYTTSFTPQTSGANPFAPTMPQTSSNDLFKNGLYFSKNQQPEAVPTTNLLRVGSAEEEILRIIPLRDSLFILKEDGIYRLTGESTSSFRVDLFDNTARVLAPESVVTVNNQIMAYSDQGIIAITETGVTVVSRPIEQTLTNLLGLNPDGIKNLSFGISYETDRKYIFHTISSAADTVPTQAFVYNTFTNSWTRWDTKGRSGLVNPADDKIYLGDTLTNRVKVERKQLNFRDFADYSRDIEITSVNDKVITVDSVVGVEVGDVLLQNDFLFGIVEEINTSFSQITVRTQVNFTIGTGRQILKAIDTKTGWVPITGQNPGYSKHWRECSFIFKRDISVRAGASFSTDVKASLETVVLESGFAATFWGGFPWGGNPWGAAEQRRTLRTYIPLEKARSAQLNVRFNNKIGFSRFKLSGMSIIYEVMSERMVR